MTPRLESLLRAFEAGRVGASVRSLDLRDRTAAGLADELQARGFGWIRRPLRAPGGGFIRNDGTYARSTDEAGPAGVVVEEIYTHPDGGFVRIRPDGIPGDLRVPAPHAVKGVLHDARRPVTFDNEAFLITHAGHPVPKSPHPSHGMRQLAVPETNEAWIDAVMREARADLVGDL